MSATPRLTLPRRGLIKAGGGLAGILALGKAPAFAQTQPVKLTYAHNVAPPESGAVVLEWMCKEVTARSKGAIEFTFHGGTLLTKEMEVMNAVKAGNVSAGGPSGAAATVFPEMGAFLVPYLVSSYTQAYRMFNGKVGAALDQTFQSKYGLKTLFFYDYGFRHFWNTKRPINEPRDLRGLKIRVQLAKVYADTVNGLGAAAVPMAWTEVITAAQQGVIDGADLPVVNMVPLKAYEVSKYFSMTFHNYGPTVSTMNAGIWNGLSEANRKLITDVAMEAQAKVRESTESVDNLAAAKSQLEPRGMVVNAPDIGPFKKVAQEKIWPAYQKQFPELWEQIVATPA